MQLPVGVGVTVTVGPLVDARNQRRTGLTPAEVTLCLSKGGGPLVPKALTDETWAETSRGYYALALSEADLDTPGQLRLDIEAPDALPYFEEHRVVPGDAVTLAQVQAELTALKGEGWTNETLKAVYDALLAQAQARNAGASGAGGTSGPADALTRGAWSDHLSRKVLDHVLGGTAYAPPQTLYVGLWTKLLRPGDSGLTVGEVTGGGYARAAVPNTPQSFTPTAGEAKANAAAVAFPVASSDWGRVVAFAILDAPTGGNILFYGELASAKDIRTGQTTRFAPNALVVRAKHDG
jgi:hypothetical protein